MYYLCSFTIVPFPTAHQPSSQTLITYFSLEVRLRRKRMPADDARGEDVQRRRRSPRVEGLPAGGGLERVTRKRQREARREPDDDRGVAAMETEGETPVAAMEVDVAEAAV